MKGNNYLLLLTACIAPQIEKDNVVCELVRKDVYLRLQDYIRALRYWLDYEDERIKVILFVENSGYDLSLLIQETKKNPYNRKIEFIQYPINKIPNGIHYGYSELEMIDKTVKNCKLIDSCQYIVKMTGRLVFPNLNKLLDRVHNDDEFIIDSRDYSFCTEQHYCVTTLFIMKIEFYNKYLYDIKRMLVPQEPYIEHLLFKILMPLYQDKYHGLRMRFPINVYPKGIGAHQNINYSSINHRIKNLFRYLFRHFIPSIWI